MTDDLKLLAPVESTGEMIQDKRLPLKERAIEFLRKNPFYKHAAWSIGKDEDTLLLWRKEDKEFSDRCEIARSESISRFVNRASPDFILTHADVETFNVARKLDITSGGEAMKSNTIIFKDFTNGTTNK